jgi:hypothetical protein
VSPIAASKKKRGVEKKEDLKEDLTNIDPAAANEVLFLFSFLSSFLKWSRRNT